MNHTVVYTHSYEYRLVNGVFRPILDTKLFYDKDHVWFGRALLDTGADYSIFDVEVAGVLGIDLTKLAKTPVGGIGGSQTGYLQKLGVKCGCLEKPVECGVYFVEGLNKRRIPNLLGRIGVFDHLQIGFDEAQRKVYMAVNQ